LFRNSSMLLEYCLEISIPISAITLTAKGLTCVGFAPALKTSYFSTYRCLSKPSAICHLAELCSHKKRTFILFIKKHLALPSLSYACRKNLQVQLPHTMLSRSNFSFPSSVLTLRSD
jgi:hypothetical protein